MTKVNQLLEKALSTSSEEEAISCLRLARKRHTGETVSVSPKSTEESSDGINWKLQAHKYYDIAVERDKMLSASRKRADYFMNEMTKAQIERNSCQSLLDYSIKQANSWKVLAVGSFVCLLGACGFILASIIFV